MLTFLPLTLTCPWFINCLDEKNKKVKFVRIPKFEEVPYPVVMEPNLVIEYYSR